MLVFLALTTSVLLFKRNKTLRAENARLENNISSVMSEIDTLRTSNGNLMADCRRILAEKEEMQTLYRSSLEKIENLGISLKRAQSVSTYSTEQHIDVTSTVRDTVYVRDSVQVNAMVFDYKDPWTEVSGKIESGEAALSISSKDTITQVIYRVPKKWWFFRWGTKAIRQRVSSSNPHNNIVYSDYIEIR